VTEPVRLGLIGAGRWGSTIIRTITALPELRLERVASRNPETAALVPQDCVVSADWHAVATAPDLDGVVIATPANLHASMATVALEAGKAVFVEKPMATGLTDAEALVELARRTGAVVHVDHTDLSTPAWRALKDSLPMVGHIEAVVGVFGDSGPFRPDVPPRWDWGPHPVAMCLDLLGEPLTVRARCLAEGTDHRGRLERIEITTEHPRWAIAHVSFGNDFDRPHRRLAVRGRRGTLVYDDKAGHPLVVEAGGHREAIATAAARPLACALAAFAESARRAAPDWRQAVLAAAVVDVLCRADAELRPLRPSRSLG
jgi:predicted dehydrogenase